MKIYKYLIFFFCLSFLFAANAQIKVIAPNGDVGIGTSTPSEKLEVLGRLLIQDGSVVRSGASASLMFDRSDKSAFIIGAGNDAGMSWDNQFNFELRSNLRSRITGNRYIQNGLLRFKILGSNGNVGIGTGAPVEKLHVNGNIQAGTMFYASDKRLKNNIKPLSYGLKEVLQLNTKTFNYHTINKSKSTDSDNVNVGIIAQELQKIAPELVSTFTWEEEDDSGNIVSSTDYLRINDTSIKWLLVNAIQEQQKIIEKLTNRLTKIETMLSSKR